MKDPITRKRLFGRTRWRRFGLLMVPGLGAVIALMFLVASGVVAVSFQMSGTPFTLNASNLSGNGFVQYATVDTVTSPGALPKASVSGKSVADTVTVLNTGSITNLDQTVCAPLPTGGDLLVTISAGNSGTPVSFTNLAANAPLLTAGQATFSKINIGQDLGTAMGGSPNGLFSQSAQSVSIDNVHQVAVGTSAETFTLPNLGLSAAFVGSCP